MGGPESAVTGDIDLWKLVVFNKNGRLHVKSRRCLIRIPLESRVRRSKHHGNIQIYSVECALLQNYEGLKFEAREEDFFVGYSSSFSVRVDSENLFGHASTSKRNGYPPEISTKLHAHRIPNSSVVLNKLEKVEHGLRSDASFTGSKDTQIQVWIEEIREMFRSMRGGSTSPSPYDTAWVSLIPALDGNQGPQFPGSLQWIIENQLEDGSWGDPDFFSISNNVLSTLVCILALKTWNTGHESVEKGASFLRKNLSRLEDEKNEMLCGFELVFPKILDDAKKLDLDIPYDLPLIDQFRTAREKKLQKLPLQLVYSSPTSLLYSLEGVRDIVDWDQILPLQQDDGSFLSSPASTACAYLYTGDEKCLQFLTSIVQQFHRAAPAQYPVDIFERAWVVDRLERLGIARHFESEIKTCLDYVYKYFSSSLGVSWSSTANVTDLDDTAMAFRLLRLHGYDVSSDCFKLFRDAERGWYTFAGEMNQGITATFNLYRAAQTCYPEDSFLREGAEWAHKFLVDKANKEDWHDKWVIGKDVAGEVGFALQSPWYYTLPHLEHRSYLDQYGPDDIWIAKVLYRMTSVTNNTFLNLAKADFNLCQTKHQEELQALLRWSEEVKFSVNRKELVYSFYTAVCCLPAPELHLARKVWTQQAVLTRSVEEFFDGSSARNSYKSQVLAAIKWWNPKMMEGSSREAKLLYDAVYNTVNKIAREGSAVQGRDISHHLHDVWSRILEKHFNSKEEEWVHLDYQDLLKWYTRASESSTLLERMTSSQFFLGEKISEVMIKSDHTKKLVQIANVVTRMSDDIHKYAGKLSAENELNVVSILKREGLTDAEAIEKAQQLMYDQMRLFVKEVHSPPKYHPVIPRSVRQLYFNITRSYLYTHQTDFGRPILINVRPRPDTEQSVLDILFEPVLT